MQLFQDIIQANQGLLGRVQGIQYGIVAEIDDPLKLGRIQVIDASKGGRSLSDWLVRILPFPQFFPPLPALGETVLVGYIDGDAHKGIYFGSLQNFQNPTLNDGTDLFMNAGTALTITVGNVGIQITPDGVINIIGANNINFDTPNVAFTSATSVSINGQQVATLGARDNRNDVLITKGWT